MTETPDSTREVQLVFAPRGGGLEKTIQAKTGHKRGIVIIDKI
jgi:hypothetical protein